MARAAGKIMQERGIRGSIINMASMSGSIVNIPQWQASHNASKAGVIHMTRSGGRVDAVWDPRHSRSPGYIATPMSVDTPQELKDAWMPLIPDGQDGRPGGTYAGGFVTLASDASGYTSGADIVVDGAFSCL